MADDKTADDKTVVQLAKERYEKAKSSYASARILAVEDTRFAMGDSDNGWQWPDDIRQGRKIDRKVCLTVNLTAQHCNQIINNIRQNSPQVRVLPVDNFSDKKSAEVMGGLIRGIQTASNADEAHIVAAEHCIYGGEGYWRIITEYESETSFNQRIRIKSIPNPLMVYIDPAARELDKSDAEWGFVFEDIGKEECKRDHPSIDPASWVEDANGWVKADMIRRAEYYYCSYTPDTLLQVKDGSEDGQMILKSAVPKEHLAEIMAKVVNQRPTQRKQWKWCKLLGGSEQPLDEQDWPGSYLPIVSVIGKELNVNGEIVRKGIVRDLKDPARMVNFSYSEAIQTVSLQNKVPYVAAAEAIEGYEEEWRNANTTNYAYLPFNAFDDSGNPIPRPERQQPATFPAAQVQMLQLSTEQMRAASGQQNANFGIKSDAQSGIGIQRLKAQGEVATFHFPDNQVRGLHYEARILIDLIPKVLDTKRIVRILGLDGKDEQATLDPKAESAYSESITEEDVHKIFNPTLGLYDVAIDTGPSYSTQRQESAEILTGLAKDNPQIMQVAGDIVVRSFDFPMADQLAKRLEKALPPGMADDKGKPQIPPEVQQKMQQSDQHIQMLESSLQEVGSKYNELHASHEDKQTGLLLDRYKAETERLKLIYPTMPIQLSAVIAQEFGLDLIAEQREEAQQEASGKEPGEGEQSPPEQAPPSQPAAPPLAQNQQQPPSTGMSM